MIIFSKLQLFNLTFFDGVVEGCAISSTTEREKARTPV